MSKTVTIKDVKWRHERISGTFEVIKDFKVTQNDGSGVITIDGSPANYPDKIRLSVHPTQLDQNYITSMATVPEKISEDTADTIESLRASMVLKTDVPLDGEWNGESEEQAISRLAERFDILHEMTEAISLGNVKSMIVSGPPGVGKSFGVEEELLRASMFEMLGNKKLKHEFVKGSVSPIGLYKKLHEFSDKNCVIVFDDCDDVLLDPVSLSLLKAALDTSKRRYLSWNKESYMLLREHVPDRFEFQGGIIFITNLDFSAVRSKVLRPHLDAMMSRCHYLSLDINTVRDKYLRIKGVVKKSEMLDDYYFENNETDLILDYLKDNVTRFQEVSLRTVLKLADLLKMKNGKDWQRIADVTLMKKGV